MPRTMVETKFYEYAQNNSGGSFEIDEGRGIGPRVWIEATNSDHANQRAESIGLYWDGVARGMDCACCGDRWTEAWRSEGVEAPEIEYGHAYVHHLDGRIERIAASPASSEAKQ